MIIEKLLKKNWMDFEEFNLKLFVFSYTVRLTKKKALCYISALITRLY